MEFIFIFTGLKFISISFNIITTFNFFRLFNLSISLFKLLKCEVPLFPFLLNYTVFPIILTLKNKCLYLPINSSGFVIVFVLKIMNFVCFYLLQT